MVVNLQLLKKLRNETQASIVDCRVALEETSNNFEKAKAWLKKRGMEKAGKKADRETSQGLIESYIHPGGRIGSLVEIACETDFVARTDEFKNLAKEIAMQVAAMNPESVDQLLTQEYIRDSSQTIGDMVKATIGKIGENIVIKRIQRFELGEK